MSLRTLTAAGAIAAAVVVPFAATPAMAVCDAYSGTCPTEPPKKPTDTGVDPTDDGTSERPVLEVTGGEVVLLSLVGGGALAVGAVLVVAGRRKVTPAA